MTTNNFTQSFKDFQTKNKTSLFFDSIISLCVFCIMLLIIASPTTYTSGTIEGLKLFVFSVLPGLFPFMFLTKLLTEIGYIYKTTQKFDKLSFKLFGTRGISLYAFLMSILSGYPIGAKIISDLYKNGQIDKNEAKKMSVFCTTSGPIFIIGTVGVLMFSNFKIGVIIYISHIVSSLLLGIFINLITRKNNAQNSITPTIIVHKKNNLLSFCISETINSLLLVGAYITLFFLISELLTQLSIFKLLTKLTAPVFEIIGINQNLSQGFLYGLVEVTRGAKNLSLFASNNSIILTTGIISFSGISIIMQSMAFLKEAKIKTHTFLLSKCVHMILSMILCYILLLII